MISISLSPNVQKDDIILALRNLCTPWAWTRGMEEKLLEEEFARRFGYAGASSFNSGRSALMAILHALNLQKGDEVLVQAFTCNAVPNPVRWAGCVPVYVDCQDDWNMSAEDLERKITKKSRVVIVQHTFGAPARIEEICAIARAHGLLVLEDCAHALGARYKGRPVGTFGDAALFSFSRDKSVSCVYGGMAASRDASIVRKIKEYRQGTPYPSFLWTLQQLCHPIIISLIVLPTYPWLGKYILVLLQHLGILSKAVHRTEKQGGRPPYFPRRLPNALCNLARNQLAKLEIFNAHRTMLATLYREELKNTSYMVPNVAADTAPAWLRFPLRHPKAHDIIRRMWKRNLLIGDWYTSPIAPADTNASLLKYARGLCPQAELLSATTLNLPTHINMSKERAMETVTNLKDCLRDT